MARGRGWLRVLGVYLLGALALGLAVWRGGPAAPLLRRERLEHVQVLDGDTVRVGDRHVRLLGFDTPERGAPWFDGDQEPYASRARRAVVRALHEARCVELLTRGQRDRYGRELGHLLVDGRPLGAVLVARGLAYETVSRYGNSGFPRQAEQILAAARPPDFEAPWRWRREHRIEPPVSPPAGE